MFRWCIPVRQREISRGAGSGLLAVDEQSALMGADGLVTALQTAESTCCARPPCCETGSLVHSKEPSKFRAGRRPPRLCTAQPHVGAQHSCQLSLCSRGWTCCLPSWAEVGLAGGDPRNCSYTGDFASTQGNPSLVSDLSPGGNTVSWEKAAERRRGASSPQ